MSTTPYTLRTITEPAAEPVTLAEAKLWCRIDDSDTAQDAMVLMMIQAMRRYAENYTRRAYVSRTLQLRLWGFAERHIRLPYAPLQSVTSITYVDSNGTQQTLDGSPSLYQWDIGSEPGIVMPIYNDEWPTTRYDLDSVRITYTCGYASLSLIPANLKLWMQARISTLNENREQLIRNNQVKIPRDFADGLLDSLVVDLF
jgi:uncharacterized phiE125 gp8 family phage protein